ncbi:MAG: hypothetical protein KAS53_05115 [Candidatus Cloacimonetes bacterium]|nr:hypothetical protein [Candidatus Cloacimonadota bacterium]
MEDFNPIDIVIEEAQNIIFEDLYIPEEFLDERPKKKTKKKKTQKKI